MSITVFLGDVTAEVADAARSFDSAAYLLDHSNLKEFFEHTPLQATVYTSLGDLPQDEDFIFELFDLATEIRYCPPRTWSDGKTVNPFDIFDSIQGATEYYLSTYIKCQPKSQAVEFQTHADGLVTLNDQRRGDGPQLWSVGCSYTSAVGVTDDQRYGHLLAVDLNLPVSFLAKAGGSIDWCADQILRSDIRPGDIVVWGLTGDRRWSYWQDGKIECYTLNHRDQSHQHPVLPPKLLDQLLIDDNMIYQGIKHINQVINFCRKLQVKLLIVGLLESAEIDMALINTPEFVRYINTESPLTLLADLGTDNQHPGPLQHQLYATFCKTFLKQLKYI